jgi:hypothetical protein
MNTEEQQRETELSIANTIIQQIRYTDKMAMMAWGVSKHIVATPSDKEYQGGLQMCVNGLKHKGYVHVQLRWVDDYVVTFLNKKLEVVKEVNGVFCDMLVDVIDWIEGK